MVRNLVGLVRDLVAMGLFSKKHSAKTMGSIGTPQLHGPEFDPELGLLYVRSSTRFPLGSRVSSYCPKTCL